MLHNVADSVAHVFNGPPHLEGLPMERLCRRALETSAIEFAIEHQRHAVATDIMHGVI
jgi:hypothetical protein